MPELAVTLELFTRALDGDDEAAAAFGHLVAERPPLTAAQRLAVYGDSSRAARIRALEQVYPVCGAVLGERCLRALARDHVLACPSRHPDLERFGADFDETLATFLEQRAGPAFSGMAYLPDLARLEWLWHLIHDGADDPGFDGPGFLRAAADAPERIVLRPSHSLRLFASPWPVHGLWRRRGLPSEGEQDTVGPDRVVLWRRGLERHAEAVDDATFELLQQLVAGATLEELAATAPQELLAHAVATGWVAGYEMRDPHDRRSF
ncbi:MAG: DNA-binding domain-containing protein [Gammaproteobacteria bacterium]|nr:DNA-binding domain-containing protein [Gammaproteobacteria bacterium]